MNSVHRCEFANPAWGAKPITVEIQLAEPADLVPLREIELAAGALFPRERIPDPDGSMDPAELQRAQTQGLLWVARLNREVVGFLAASAVEDDLYVQEVSVHPRAARRGIGRALMEVVIGAGQEQGRAAVTLTTFSDLPWNGPFYASMGFVQLAHADLPSYLREYVEEETAMGMTHRVGMVLPLTSHGDPNGI